MENHRGRAGRKPVHVWIRADLVEKIRAENNRASEKRPWYERELLQDTYERILGAYFDKPAPKPKAKGKT